jgi:hypothetical protein
MYIMASEPISTAYFINPSHQSVTVYYSIVPRQCLGKNATAGMNTQAKIDRLLDASFSMRSVSDQGLIFLEHLVLLFMVHLTKTPLAQTH